MLKHHITFSKFTLLVALCISLIAAYYSVKGLTIIFAGAVIEIIVMGSILEVAKITTTVWLHRYWHKASIIKRIYLTTAVVVLALLTSMGVFGLLSKAHIDQNLGGGEIQAQVALFDERIRIERENIETARRTLQQMNDQVDQRLQRGTTESSAERSVQIRRQQTSERTSLQNEIMRAQQQISKLNEQRAPIASELRKAEAEVGPIKYIAAMIYSDNPDSAILERAVRMVIIMIVLVFDPLAIILILAANNSIRWDREDEINRSLIKYEETVVKESIIEEPIIEEPAIEEPIAEATKTEIVSKNASKVQYDIDEPLGIGVDDDNQTQEKMRFFDSQEYVHFGGKLISIKALKEIRPDLIVSERDRDAPIINFDTKFPYEAVLGEIFIKVDCVPHATYKFNGKKWLPINKNQNTTYLQSHNYLRYLIKKIELEEYDINVLTASEQDEISEYLKKN